MQGEITTLGYYLIIARYDRAKWKQLSQDATQADPAMTEHKQAEQLANTLFPRQRPGGTADTGLPLPYPAGVLLVHSFHSNIHKAIADKGVKSMPDETYKETELDEIFDAFDSNTSPDETAETDPGIGWIAVVHRDSFDQFVATLGGKDGPLWKMYTTEIIPLHDDDTTRAVYRFMTPVHWN